MVYILTDSRAYLSIIMKQFCFIIISIVFSHILAAQNRLDSVRLNITISSDDLSEDMSRLSSGNDELILIAYETYKEFQAPIMVQEFVFDKNSKKITFEASIYDSTLSWNSYPVWGITIVLLERDSKASIKKIEPPIRIYKKEIEALYKNKKSSQLEEYLGDEDLLLLCNFSVMHDSKESCTQKYVNNMDTYSYKVEIDNTR